MTGIPGTEDTTASHPEPVTVLPFQGSVAVWDRHVETMPDTTFCHLGGWREIMVQVLGLESVYRIAVDGTGTVRGLLPLVRVKSRLFGDYLVSMPFLNYGGPVGTTEARSALATHAADEAQRLGVDLLELRARTPVPGDLPLSTRKLTVLLELPDDSQVLWKEGLRSKVRSQIRRPLKEGMTTRFGPECVDDFYRVFSRTMRDLGTPVLPSSFFRAIASHFPEQALFCVVDLQDKAVAAGCGFFWADEFEITWAGALREYSRSAPNMLLYWSLLERAIDRDARVFNFGRCSPGSGTHRFKKQWGGADYPLPWAQWRGGERESTPSPDQGRFSAAISVWQRLPLPLANWLGPKISRHLP